MASIGAMRPAGVKLQKQDTQIERADQEKINEFSRHNMKKHDLEDQIKKLKEEIGNFGDANDIIDETFGEEGALKLFLGEALIAVEEDAARDYVETVNNEKQEELEAKQEALEDIEKKMGDLKSFLYAKFGNSINLEEDK